MRDPADRWPDRDEPGGRPPPRREQLPLPRRTQQAHLAPQLRDPDTTDSGTPFAAFAPAVPGQRPSPDQDTAAAFQDGTRQARRHRGPRSDGGRSSG